MILFERSQAAQVSNEIVGDREATKLLKLLNTIKCRDVVVAQIQCLDFRYQRTWHIVNDRDITSN
jgi:hypothetical protein